MNNIYRIFLILIAGLGASGINRYGLFIGSNDGGKNRERLLYAQSDANAMQKVLSEMGGLSQNNTVFIAEPRVRDVDQALEKINAFIQNEKTKGRSEFVFYYSGHADEKGLFLGKEKYEYTELKKRIDALHVDVKIAIVDACASGAMTRLKGGTRRQPFLAGQSSDLKGYAIITSSSEDEASQESDQIKGSFFTHYLISGMRGAADASGDGKVTLSESYQYAFQETTLRTSRTKGGVQHPNYDMKLAGVGEVVMTDVRTIGARVELSKESEGRYFFKNEKSQLVAEVSKNAGQDFKIGLPVGTYEIIRLWNGQLSHAKLILKKEESAKINDREFLHFTPESTVSRGGSKVDRYVLNTQADEVENDVEVDAEEWDFLLNQNHRPTKGLQMSLFGNFAHRRHRGLQAAIFLNYAKEDVNSQISAGVNVGLGHVNGLQLTSVANLLGTRWNWNTAGELSTISGVQFSGSFNYAEAVYGAQVGSAYNGALDVVGAQLGAALNTAREIEGAQIVGGINIAGNVTGLQLAGGLNLAQNLKGAQIGVLNMVDTLRGFQLGVINIANQNEGLSLGLINYARNGLFQGRITSDETGAGKISFVMGLRALYTEYIVGGYDEEEKTAIFGIGLGSELLREEYWNLHIGAEYTNEVVIAEEEDIDTWNDQQQTAALKLQVGVKPFKDWFEVFVGARYAMAWGFHGDQVTHEPFTKPWGNESFRHWPGAYLGIAFGQL